MGLYSRFPRRGLVDFPLDEEFAGAFVAVDVAVGDDPADLECAGFGVAFCG